MSNQINDQEMDGVDAAAPESVVAASNDADASIDDGVPVKSDGTIFSLPNMGTKNANVLI